MKIQKVGLLVIVFLILLGTVVNADSYKYSFKDFYGEKIYYTQIQNGDTCTVNIIGFNIKSTEPSCEIANYKARDLYETTINGEKAKDSDDALSRLRHERIDPNSNEGKMFTNFRDKDFPELLNSVYKIFGYVLILSETIYILGLVYLIIQSAVIKDHPMIRAQQYKKFFSVLIGISINTFLMINTVFMKVNTISLLMSIRYSKDLSVLTYKGASTITAVTYALIGFGVLTFVLIFIIAIVNLARSAGNPQARSQALNDLAVKGMYLAMLGGVSFIIAFAKSLGSFSIM